MAKKLHLCRWSHCRCDSREIQPDDEVKIGGSYYHKACAEEKQTIDEIMEVWSTQIDEYVQFSKLRSIVNQLVYKRGYDPNFVLYIVQCGAREHWLKHEAGLYTAVKDEKRYAEWCKAQQRKNHPDRVELMENKGTTFTYHSPKKKTILDLFD